MGWVFIVKFKDWSKPISMEVQLVNQYCPTDVKNIVCKFVSRSSYFVHPELLLLTPLASDQEEERREGVKIIRDKIRKGGPSGSSLPRKFDAPPINFEPKILLN